MTPHLASTPVLTTERLTLRAPLPQDFPAFAAFLSSPRSQFVRDGELDNINLIVFMDEIVHLFFLVLRDLRELSEVFSWAGLAVIASAGVGSNATA